MAIKNAQYFTIDSLLAAGIIIIVVLLVSNYYVSEKQRTNLNYVSQDVALVFSSMKVGDVNSDYVKKLVSEGKISRINNTILEQIGEFWSQNQNDIARNLTIDLIESLIPKQFGISVLVDGDEIYKRNNTITTALVSSVRMISGITKDKPTRGFSTRLFLGNIKEKAISNYVYFGGFEGQGNITRFLSIPGDASIKSMAIELDANQNFSFYINKNKCLGIFQPSKGALSADSWDISSCSNFMKQGYNVTNNFTFEFLENNLTSAFIGGGLIRVAYSTSELVKPLPNSSKYWFSGINGYTNIFSSLYTPGNLTAMSVHMHYNNDLAANSTIVLFLGNASLDFGNSSGNTINDLDNRTIASNLNFTDLNSKNYPLRLGSGESAGGAADITLVSDLSGSMQTCDKSKRENQIDASFCGGNLFYDNFNDGIDDGWTRNGGVWTAASGAYTQTSSAIGNTTAGNIDWNDYNFRVDLKPITGNPIGVYFRYQNSSYYYKLQSAKNAPYTGFILYRNIGNGDELLAQDNYYIPTGTSNTLYLSIIGDRITFDIDKSDSNSIYTTIDVVDPNGPKNGKIGLYTNNNANSVFDNVFVGLDQGFCKSEGYCNTFSNDSMKGIFYNNIVLSDLGSSCSGFSSVPNCGSGTTPYCYSQCSNNGPINFGFRNCGGQGVGYSISPCCSGDCCSGQQVSCGTPSCWVSNTGGQSSSFADCNPISVWDANSLTACAGGCSRYSEYNLGTCADNPSPTSTWCFGVTCNSRPGAAQFGSTCSTNSNIYITMNKTGLDSNLAYNNFESGLSGWASRDGSMNVARDSSTSSEGAWSVKLQDTNGGAGSSHIMQFNTYKTANISKIEFDYKCEAGARWGWMFYSSSTGWSCIKGSGNQNCGANYRYVGKFQPDVVCDNSWHHAQFRMNEKAAPDTVSGGANLGTIIGDWSADASNANKNMWFDNVTIKFEDRSFIQKCSATIPVPSSSPTVSLTACNGNCNDLSFTQCVVGYTKLQQVSSCAGSTADYCQCFPSEGADPVPCYTYTTSYVGYRNHWRQCDGVYGTGYWKQYNNYSSQSVNYFDCNSVVGTFACRNKYWNNEFDDSGWTSRSTPHQNWGCDYCSYFYRKEFVFPQKVNNALNKPATGSQPVPFSGPYGKAVNDNINDFAYNFNFNGIGLQWLQVDLGKIVNISSITLWHYFVWPNNAYINNTIAVSDSGAFSGEEVVLFNSEVQGRYVETADGKEINISSGILGRYVRNWINGSNYSISGKQYNIWNEIQVYSESSNITSVNLSIGSDDGVICYLNNRMVRYNPITRTIATWNEIDPVDKTIVINGTNILSCQVIDTSGAEGFNARLNSDFGNLVPQSSQWKSYGLTNYCSNDGSYQVGSGAENDVNKMNDPAKNTCEYGVPVDNCDSYYPQNQSRNLSVAAWSDRGDSNSYTNGLLPIATILAQYNNGKFYSNISGFYTSSTPSPAAAFWTGADILIVDGNNCNPCYQPQITNALNSGKIVITSYSNFWKIQQNLGIPQVNSSQSYNHVSWYFKYGTGKLIGDQYNALSYRWSTQVLDKRVKAANLFNGIQPIWYQGSNPTQSCKKSYCLPKTEITYCSGCDFTRIKLAKKLDILFANLMMQSKSGKVGLVAFGNDVCGNNPLSSNNTQVKQNIANYRANCGSTCISCAIKAAWDQLRTSLKPKYIFLMTDGEANTCLDGSFCGSTAAANEAFNVAMQAYNQSQIVFYTVGFGPEASGSLLRWIASNTTGTFCQGNDSVSLEQCYLSVANEIKYRSQAVTIGTDITSFLAQTRFDLYPDSYIELNYTPEIVNTEFGKILVSPPPQKVQTCSSTVNVYPEIKVIDAKVTSYSSEHWTNFLSVNSQTIFNLTNFGQNYVKLGDPFTLNIPPSSLNTGLNNIIIGTGDNPVNSTGCSQNNSFIYSGLINLSTPYSTVSAKAEGCNWNLEFYDGSFSNVAIPSNYSGPNVCSYTHLSSSYNANDAFQISAFNLISLLDFDKDRRLDVKFDTQQIGVNSNLITQVPSLWGPAIIEIRVWK